MGHEAEGFLVRNCLNDAWGFRVQSVTERSPSFTDHATEGQNCTNDPRRCKKPPDPRRSGLTSTDSPALRPFDAKNATSAICTPRSLHTLRTSPPPRNAPTPPPHPLTSHRTPYRCPLICPPPPPPPKPRSKRRKRIRPHDPKRARPPPERRPARDGIAIARADAHAALHDGKGRTGHGHEAVIGLPLVVEPDAAELRQRQVPADGLEGRVHLQSVGDDFGGGQGAGAEDLRWGMD